ncbi:MAG: DeoR/GlpR transcriptional regulator [Anaerolineales bacterium]|nr:DeoR/GlpR transcriptional regulator [Anaerolineales bacterium]
MLWSKELYLEERRQEILRQVDLMGRVSVAELSQQLGVSEVTIRVDLQALAEQNLIVRTHGGAIPAGNMYELALALRRQRQVQEKSRIGQAGASLVLDGDAIFLDSSSTVLAIVQHLKNHRHLTIITNSLVIAQELQDTPSIRVVMSGGTLQRETASLIGVDGLEFLRKFNIQKGFFGAHGLNLPEGLTDVSADEAEVKRALVGMCRQTIAVLDATKWGRVGLASFARPEQIDTVITDEHAPADLLERVRTAGIEIVVV